MNQDDILEETRERSLTSDSSDTGKMQSYSLEDEYITTEKTEMKITENNKDTIVRPSWKKLKTVCAASIMCAVGASVSAVGPTLPNLEILLETRIDVLGQALSAQNIGALVSTVIVMTCYDRVNPELTMGVSTMVSGLCTAIAPFFNINTFIVLMGIRGLTGIGYSYSAAHAYCLHIYAGDDKRRAMVMQAMYACYAICSTIAPILESPMLVNIDHAEDIYPVLHTPNNTNQSAVMSYQMSSRPNETNIYGRTPDYSALPTIYNNNDNQSMFNASTNTELDVSSVRYVYVMFGVMLLIPSTLFFLQLTLERTQIYLIRNKNTRTVNNRKEPSDSGEIRSQSSCLIWLSVIPLAFVQRALWQPIGDYIASVVVHLLGMSVNTASWLTSSFWLGYLAGNVLASVLALFIKPHVMLCVSLSTLSLSLGVLTTMPIMPTWLLWICIPLVGLSQSPTMPAVFVWITPLIPPGGLSTGVILLIMNVGGLLTSIFLPIMTYRLSYMWVIYVSLAASMITSISILCIYIIMRGVEKHTQQLNVALCEESSGKEAATVTPNC